MSTFRTRSPSSRRVQLVFALLGLVTLLFLGWAPLVDARVEKSEIKNDDRALVPVAAAFGFEPHGVIHITLSEMSMLADENLMPEDIDKNKIGFFLTKADAEFTAASKGVASDDLIISSMCLLEQDNASGMDVLFTWSDVASQSENGIFNYELVFSGTAGQKGLSKGLYTLFYCNCNSGTATSFKLKVEMYNLPYGTSKRNYLSAGEMPLPYMYLTFFFAYIVMTGLWAYEVLIKEKATAKRIHSFMLLLLVFKALTLVSQAGMYFLIKDHGESEGWRYVYYIFSFARGLMLFTVIVLVGTGYTFIKPFLAPREKNIIMFVVPLQVLSDIAQVILNEETPITRGYFAWNDLFHLVDIICCCAVLFPIVWSIKHHRESAAIDGKAARSVAKLVLFRQFYVMVVAYIYFTRIIVELLRSMQSYDQTWFSDFMNEIATMLFYAITGWKFRPMGDNPYFQLQEGDLSEAELAQLVDGL